MKQVFSKSLKIGLHLILEGHNLRPLAIPLMMINLIQLGLIVFHHVFTPDVKSAYLIFDLIFFVGMTAFSIFMLAHIGLLRPIRRTIAYTFDRNSSAIRTEELRSLIYLLRQGDLDKERASR